MTHKVARDRALAIADGKKSYKGFVNDVRALRASFDAHGSKKLRLEAQP